MAKPFDATTKQLVEAQPQAWLAFVGLGDALSAEVIEADLSTVTADADRVLRVNGPPAPFLAHLEFQAGYDRAMGERLLRYNVLLRYRHGLPVRSIVLLLRREADGPALTGAVRDGTETEQNLLHFRYRVVRVYEQPVEAVLAGGLATLPLAPLADVSPSALPGVVRRMEERIGAEAAPDQAGMLWTAAYVLMGLKYPAALVTQLLKGVRQMKESATYQAILQEGRAEGEARGEEWGRAEEARALIVRLGRKRFGSPDAATEAALGAITSRERLEQLAERLLEAESWSELLA